MVKIDANGMLLASQVRHQRYPFIEHGTLDVARAIVVHQTDTDITSAVLSSCASGGNGAHFLIEKSGQILQTASLGKRCYHVGRLIKSRCFEIKGSACKDPAVAAWREGGREGHGGPPSSGRARHRARILSARSSPAFHRPRTSTRTPLLSPAAARPLKFVVPS